MNPELPKNPRDEMEMQITALLLGELSAEEAAALRRAIEQDAELARLLARLQQTVGLVREAAASTSEPASAQTAPLKLSAERREKLLAHFKTVAPKEFVPEKRRARFTLVELAAVLAILGFLASTSIPNFVHSRTSSQSNVIINNLRQIDAAKQQWALENNKASKDALTFNDIKPYLGRGQSGELPPPVAGETYVLGKVGDSPSAYAGQGKKQKHYTLATVPEKSSSTFSSGKWGNDQAIASGSLSSAPAAANPGGLPSANIMGYYSADDGKMERRQIGGPADTLPRAPATPPSQIVLPSIALADADGVAGTAGTKIVAGFGDSGRLGKLHEPAMNGDSSGHHAADLGLPPVEARTDLYFSTWQPQPGSSIDPATGLPAGAIVAYGGTPPATPSAIDSWAYRVGGQESNNGYRVGGFGGGGGGRGGGGEVSANGRSFGIELPKDSGVTPPILESDAEGKRVAALSDGRGVPAVKDRIDDEVPALGDLTMAGRLLRSEQPSSVALGQGFSLLGSTEPPKFSNDELRTSGANTFIGGTLANNSILTLDGLTDPKSDVVLQQIPITDGSSKNSPIPDGGRLGVEPEVQRIDPPGSTGAPARVVKTPGAYPLTPSGENALAVAQNEVERLGKELNVSEAMPEITGPSPTYDSSGMQKLRVDAVQLEGQTAKQEKQLAQLHPFPAASLTNKLALSRQEDIDTAARTRPYWEAKQKLSELAQFQKVLEAKADVAIRMPATNAPIPQTEVQTSENPFSTFSLNVSDVSFKLAAASLEKGQMPDPASVRSEEFINAFDYRDPEPAAGASIAFAYERARYPFAHHRDLLRFSIKTAAEGRQAGRPLNIVLLLDNSGSMERADRVQIIREALRVLASQLQPQDKLSVITFARTARLFADGVSGENAGEIAEQLSGLTPEGGTNLEDALNLAYQAAARHYLANGINRVVLLTDGAANLGDVEPDSLKQKVQAQRKQGIALDCFGIGWEGFNDDLLEVLSRNGDGRYGFLNSPEEAASEFASQLAGALKVAASDVKVQVEFNPKRVTSYRQIGYAKHQLTKEQFRDNTVDAAQIAAQEAGNALYTVEVNPAGEGPLCTVRVRYKIPGTTDYREHAWDVPFSGNAVSLEQASAALRLAATGSAFSEWLVASPFAGEVTPDQLLGMLRGVPEIYGADARPKKLEWMIRQAKSIEGK